MKIKDMEIFLDLLNTQSPTHTANNFSITQPNVSIIIKNLEQDCGVLFERLGKKLLPTPKALFLGKIWNEIVTKYYQSLEQISDDENLLGSLHLACTQSIAEYFIATFLFDFKNNFPKTKFYFQTQNTKECLNLLKSGVIELALIEAKPHYDEDLKWRLWCKDELVAVSSDESLSQREYYIDELLNHKWILREKGSGLRETFLNALGKIAKDFPIFLELDRAQTIKELVLKKNALAVFSKKSIEKELKNKELFSIKLKNINLKREFFLVKRKNYHYNRTLEKFENFLFN